MLVDSVYQHLDWYKAIYQIENKELRIQFNMGPVLFNIFLCDLFCIINDVEFASYADDNMLPIMLGEGLSDVMLKFKYGSKTFFKWFNDHQMKANPDKIA